MDEKHFIEYLKPIAPGLNNGWQPSMIWNVRKIEHKSCDELRVYKMPLTRPSQPLEYIPKGQGNNPGQSQRVSLSRSAQIIRWYILNNSFNYFMTFTFDPNKVDSTNIQKVYLIIKTFIKTLRNNHGDIKYLFVPEYHSDKNKIHLHSLITGNIPLQPLIIKNKHIHDKMDNPLYHYEYWTNKYGFNSAAIINTTNIDRVKIANYVAKYITKDMITTFNKQRFWVSQGLKKPIMHDLGLINEPQLSMQWDYANEFIFIRRDLKAD